MDYKLRKVISPNGETGLMLLTISIVSILLLTVSAIIVQYRRSTSAIENFDGDDLPHLKCCGKEWQIERLEVRVAKLGWHAIERGPETRGIHYVIFEREVVGSATLTEVLKRLQRAGYFCEPVRQNLDISEMG